MLNEPGHILLLQVFILLRNDKKVFSKPIQDLAELRQRITEATKHINSRRYARLITRYYREEHVREIGKGCVQGSIGGPMLWSLLLDPLLPELEARNYYVQAFADDVVLVFEGETAHEVERRANAALEHVWE
ncbi:unnamed protein product [Euphydryas editha]|uniref:Reverse transcriptase domain-containing protein n=1 Tax=Euphydryas editha TaxID=104508 RepID=A0AAU9TKT0_EUPED|nr:unnamed protein product [Euphydryas editha]